jgi:hypothetical protein
LPHFGVNPESWTDRRRTMERTGRGGEKCAMARHRRFSFEFKRQVALDFLEERAGLRELARKHSEFLHRQRPRFRQIIAPLRRDRSQLSKIAARVGIDSGTVVIGAGAGKDIDVFGDTPNIAARVQGVAESDSILITDATHRLISGLFIVEDRGVQSLKGVEQPVRLYRVLRPSVARGRFKAAAAHGLTPFVGREEEIRLLMSRWKHVREGEGQLLTIIGEAGIGKSRLVQHFRDQIAADGHPWLECGTAAFFQNTPFYAVADMLRQTFHWRAIDAGTDSITGGTECDRTASVALHDSPGVSRLMAVQSPSHLSHSESFEAVSQMAAPAEPGRFRRSRTRSRLGSG